MMAKNEMTVTGKFDLVSMYSGMDEAAKAEFEDELSDLGDGGIDYRAIKMPSGKVKSFTVESDDPEDPDQEKELVGVMVFTHLMNARWKDDFGGESKAPVCSSWDAKTGLDTETGAITECDRCPYNQFRDDGTGITRKECKNMRRIYLMLNGKPNLYMLVVPPTSLRDVRTQLKRIMSGGRTYTSMILSFTLTGAVSKGGQDYAKIVIRKAGDLTPEQWASAREMRESIKESYKSVTITADDYYTPEDDAPQAAPAPATGPDGFMNIPEGVQQELPFT
jgi:hypothetical protein